MVDSARATASGCCTTSPAPRWLRQLARAVVQVAPLAAVVLLALGFGWIAWVGVGCGHLFGWVTLATFVTKHFSLEATVPFVRPFARSLSKPARTGGSPSVWQMPSLPELVISR